MALLIGLAAFTEVARAGQLRPISPTPTNQQEQIRDTLVAFQKHQKAQFGRQSNRDRLLLLTGNSFLAPEYRPLAGAPILLVVAVKRWDYSGNKGGVVYNPGFRNIVRFRLVGGTGTLVPYGKLSLPLGAYPTAQLTEVTETVDVADRAGVWMRGRVGSVEPVRIEISLEATGERRSYVDKGKLMVVVEPRQPKGDEQAENLNALRRSLANKSSGKGVGYQDVLEVEKGGRRRVLARQRFVFRKGHFERRGAPRIVAPGGESAVAQAQTSHDTWVLSLPSRVTHIGPNENFARLTQYPHGLALDVCDAGHLDAGAVETVLAGGDQNFMVLNRTQRSFPVQAGKHWLWSEVSRDEDPDGWRGRGRMVLIHRSPDMQANP